MYGVDVTGACRAKVTGDPDPELRDHAPNNATDTVTEEDKWQARLRRKVVSFQC